MGEYRSDADRIEVLERKIKSQAAKIRRLEKGQEALTGFVDLLRQSTAEYFQDSRRCNREVLDMLASTHRIDLGALDMPRLPKGERAPGATTIGERP